MSRMELGHRTWGFLHTMAAYYPQKPTDKQRRDMNRFLELFSRFYPCTLCARDLRKDLRLEPPVTDCRENFEQWMCRLHNGVNRKLGKPQFDCTKVKEKWHGGLDDKTRGIPTCTDDSCPTHK